MPESIVRHDVSRTGAKAYPVFYLYGLKQEDKVSSACDTLMRHHAGGIAGIQMFTPSH